MGWADSDGGIEAYRWTAATGMVGLGGLPGPLFLNTRANDVSADGSVLVGTSNSPGGYQAIRWTEATGMVGLGIPAGLSQSQASSVSADGSVVVGHSSGGTVVEAFRWTAATGMVGLGDLPGGTTHSEGYDVSGDGSIVVGLSNTDAGNEAMMWTEDLGMVNLKDYLLANGVTAIADWTLTRATAISSDGTTIVGSGYNPSGGAEGYLLTIPAQVPEPSTWILALGALVGLLIARRRLVG